MKMIEPTESGAVLTAVGAESHGVLSSLGAA